MGILTIIENVWTKFQAWLADTVEPEADQVLAAIEAAGAAWLKQFETDFGQKALAVAVSAVAALGDDASVDHTVAVGATVLKQLASDAEAIGKADAEKVALNAARTALNAIGHPDVVALAQGAPASDTAPGTSDAATGA